MVCPGSQRKLVAESDSETVLWSLEDGGPSPHSITRLHYMHPLSV